MDGATQTEELIHVLLPLCTPALPDGAAFHHPLLERSVLEPEPDKVKAATLTAFTASFSSPEGLFWRNCRRLPRCPSLPS